MTGIGSYVPERHLTNSDLEKMVDTSDEWIVSRTGIRDRRIAADNEFTSDMAAAAAKKAIKMAGLKPADIDLLMVGTVTPDYKCPSVSCIVQNKIGLVNAATMDIAAACAGFLHGLTMADAFIKTRKFKRILVIGVEKLSTITDYTDRNTCVLFGDGAGAAVFEPSDNDSGILSTFIKSDGRYAELLWVPAGGSAQPPQTVEPSDKNLYLKMNGRDVFKHAVREMADASIKVLEEAGIKAADLDILVAHQANIRIIDTTAKRLGLPKEKVFLNIAKYGNTSAASVPIALEEALQEGRIKKGSLILMTAFGSGLTWASALMRW